MKEVNDINGNGWIILVEQPPTLEYTVLIRRIQTCNGKDRWIGRGTVRKNCRFTVDNLGTWQTTIARSSTYVK